jgi:ribosome-binding ATPase
MLPTPIGVGKSGGTYPRPMARVGILGLPNVGKTALFNALTGLGAPTAAHPFSTTEPNVGVAKVPDDRLDEAARLEESEKTVYATLDLLDLPAMAGPGGSGLGAQFLGRLREMEALTVVLRAFHDDGVPDGDSGTDPAAQAETLLLELTLADAEIFTRRADKAAKESMSDAALKPIAAAIARAAAHLEEGLPLRLKEWTEQELASFRDLAPLTLKPAVWVVNVDEGSTGPDAAAAVEAVVPDGDLVVVLSAQIEEEAAQLDPEDRVELLEGLGLGDGALPTMVRAVYSALGVLSFFTVGPKESRAWTVREGAAAPEAAGKIHSDLERGFIRAEVTPIASVLDAGGWDAAKAAGSVRLEGKDYVVAEGDVIVVRFSV